MPSKSIAQPWILKHQSFVWPCLLKPKYLRKQFLSRSGLSVKSKNFPRLNYVIFLPYMIGWQVIQFDHRLIRYLTVEKIKGFFICCIPICVYTTFIFLIVSRLIMSKVLYRVECWNILYPWQYFHPSHSRRTQGFSGSYQPQTRSYKSLALN